MVRGKYRIKEKTPIKLRLEKANKIIDYVDDYFNVKCNQLGRKSYIVIPRQMAMYYIREHMDLSYREIGELFPANGKAKTHATALHAYRLIKSLIQVDVHIRSFDADLKDGCKSISELNEFDIEKYNIIKKINNYLIECSLDDVKNIENYISTSYVTSNEIEDDSVLLFKG
jgi:hypothetical protein